MKEYIKERAVAIANYIVDYNATVISSEEREQSLNQMIKLALDAVIL